MIPKEEMSENPYPALRSQALSAERREIGVAEPPPERPVWGMLMETKLPNGACFSLVAFADGTSSLYLSTGGGIIGGHSHENVRQAASSFLALANQLHRSMNPADASPLPAAGGVAFYARTDAGLLAAHVGQGELAAGSHPLSPLFFAGHHVIAEFRKTVGPLPGAGA